MDVLWSVGFAAVAIICSIVLTALIAKYLMNRDLIEWMTGGLLLWPASLLILIRYGFVTPGIRAKIGIALVIAQYAILIKLYFILF